MDARWHDNEGCWNAYVEGGRTREQRRARLDEVPESMRARVEAHVQMAFSLKRGRAS